MPEWAVGLILFMLAGGFLSRLCGRGSVIPLGLEQFLYAAPYGLIFTGALWSIIPYLVAVMGKRTGHAQYMNLGYEPMDSGEKPVFLDFIVRFWFGYDYGGNYWRCVTGLAVTGLAVTLLAGIFYAVEIDPLRGAAIALSGLCKPIAYMVGWALREEVGIRVQPTYVGECLNGALSYGVLYACLTL